MFKFSKAFSRPVVRRTLAGTAVAAAGFGLGTSVAFAKSLDSPLTVDYNEVSTGVPKLTPRDLTEVTTARLEEPAEERRAFNPETGEIDWDCPCLGGMAHGPCGEEFKAAFSCFVYSKEEIKGSECIPKFSAMQNCFKKYPEVYAEFAEDENVESRAGSKLDDVQSNVKKAAHDAKDFSKNVGEDIESSAKGTLAIAKNAVSDTKEAFSGANDKLNEARNSIAGAKDSLVADSKAALSDAKDAANGIRGRLSDAKDSVANSDVLNVSKDSSVVHQYQDKLKDTASAGLGFAGEVVEKTSDSLRQAGDSAAQLVSQLSESASDALNRASSQSTIRPKGPTLNDEASESLDETVDALKQVKDAVVARGHDVAENSDLANQAAGVLKQSQQFASEAIAGVTAEAQSAVNYINEKFK